MARRVEEIKRVHRQIDTNNTGDRTMTDHNNMMVDDETPGYEEEYYDVGSVPEEAGLNTASGVLALVLLALAVYLIWAALR